MGRFDSALATPAEPAHSTSAQVRLGHPASEYLVDDMHPRGKALFTMTRRPVELRRPADLSCTLRAALAIRLARRCAVPYKCASLED
jgi:hypothetical protein